MLVEAFLAVPHFDRALGSDGKPVFMTMSSFPDAGCLSLNVTVILFVAMFCDWESCGAKTWNLCKLLFVNIDQTSIPLIRTLTSVDCDPVNDFDVFVSAIVINA
jgi:hypothetical protein